MKKKMAAICAAALLLGGCTARQALPKMEPTETVELPILGQPGKNAASVVLCDIWAQYEETERFSVYGGLAERPVPDAPGDLDMQKPEAWAAHLRFPLGCLPTAQQGAAITHLLDGSLFTAAVVRLSDGKALSALTRAWRQEIQQTKWQSASPKRLLLVQIGEQYLAMAMGSKEYIHTFRQKLLQAYPSAKAVCDEAITG